MIMSLKRINELSVKARNKGLSVEETKERSQLRQEYLAEIRGQVLSTINSVKIVNVLGEDITPKKLVEEKKRNKSL